MPKSSWNVLFILFLFATFFVYFYPVTTEINSLLNYSFVFANFFLFFILGVLLYVSYEQFSKIKSVCFLVFLSFFIQVIQSQFENRQFDLDSAFYNSLGSAFGVFFFRLVVEINYLIYFFINSTKTYPSSFYELLTKECDEEKEREVSFVKDFIRFSHFSINKHLNKLDNKLISLKLNSESNILFPIMSGNIFKHVFYGTPEPDTSVILSEIVSKGDLAFDLGAHYGFFSLELSRLVGKSGKVFSFEPTKSTFDLLQKNTRSKDNINCINQGFFSVEVSLSFNDYGSNYSGLNSIYSPRLKESLSSEQSIVNFIKLDRFVAENRLIPNLIKIDCESAEYEILKGAITTIKKYKPKIIIEFGDIKDKDLPRSKEVVALLEKNSFLGFRRFKEGYKRLENQGYYPYFNALFLHKSEMSEFFDKETHHLIS